MWARAPLTASTAIRRPPQRGGAAERDPPPAASDVPDRGQRFGEPDRLTLGAAVEWAVNNKWSLGAEYRHTDFGTHTFQLGTDLTGAAVNTNVRLTTDQVTLRANWHFAAQ